MKTHWKKLTNPDYLGSYDFQPDEVRTVKITKVQQEQVMGANGKKEPCIVAYLEGSKPMILNRTNCKTISGLFKTAYIEEWAGKSIKIRSEWVKAFGTETEALRVVNELVKDKPALTPANKVAWEQAVNAMKVGKVTVSQIRARYTLSDEDEAELILCVES